MKHDVNKFCSQGFKYIEAKSRLQPNRWYELHATRCMMQNIVREVIFLGE